MTQIKNAVDIDFTKNFDYENGFYLTSSISRISKFVAHLEFFKRTSHLMGEIVECGVFKGVSLARLVKFRALLENCYSRKIIAFDTFGKFPEAKFADDVNERKIFVEEAGDQSISTEDFTTIMEELELNQNIYLEKGDILDTVPAYVKANPQLKISLLHIDVDLYEPTQVCLEHLAPRVVKGGIIILDDYGAFAGANKAIDEYFDGKDIQIKKLPESFSVSYVDV